MRTKIKLQSALIIIAMCLGVNVFSQGLYINAGAGYGFPAACYLMEENFNYNSSSGDYWEIVKGSGSYGKGIQPGINIGYMFNPNIGADLGISYLLGGKIESKDEVHNDSGSEIYEYTMSAKMLRFTPALKMTVGNGNVKPYMRAGLVIGVAGKIKSEIKDTSTGYYGNDIEESVREFTGGISLGFSGALGADFMLSDNIGIFAEMGVITQSWAPKKGEMTKYTRDGVDLLDDLTTYIKEVEFVESFTRDYNNFDENSPQQVLKTYYPFSSVGINAGIRIALGGSSAAK
jgi:outer membrane protein W